MDTSKAINTYLNYAFLALGVICAVALTVAILVSP
jgi:hypothetical protein